MENPPMDDIEKAVFSHKHHPQLLRNIDSARSASSSSTQDHEPPSHTRTASSRLHSKRPAPQDTNFNYADIDPHRKQGSKLGMMWETFLSSSPFSGSGEPSTSTGGSGASRSYPGDEHWPITSGEMAHGSNRGWHRQHQHAAIVTSSPMPLHSNRSTTSFQTDGFSLVYPPSPSAILDFNSLSFNSTDEIPNCGLFNRQGTPPRFHSPGSARRFLPRLFGSLGAPTREKRSKGKGKASDPSDSLDFDDEACFVDIKETSGMDVIAHLPSEIALYILIHLDLQSVIACLSVSRYWRNLTLDPLIWRELYLRQGWTVNNVVAARQLRNSYRHIAPPIPPSPSATPSNLTRQLSLSFSRHSVSGSSSPNPVSHGRRTSSISNRLSIDNASITIPHGTGFAPSLSLDWIGLYKVRREVDRRWANIEPKVTHLSGHEDSVYCLEFDSDKVITGSRDRTIKVWSLRTGELRTTLRGHGGSVLCLKFDYTGFMVSGSSDRSIFVWDLLTGAVRRVLNGHAGGVLDLRIDSNWIVSCSKDAIIRVWNRKTLELYCALQGHEGPVNAVGLQDDKVVSASGDGKMMLWDLPSKTRLRTFEGHDRGLACIDFKGDLIISGSNDRKIKVWSASTGECLQTFAGHDLLVRALAFDPLLGRLVSASYDKSVKVWDLKTGKCVRDFKDYHTSHIFDVKFDATRIVSSSHDEKIVVLDFGSDLDTSLFV